ncbi:MAG: hypothetical protein Q7T20_05455 [Saprospiraceae bacterium]|nr:hypothetical protein [Saprospiraceae bacterium]
MTIIITDTNVFIDLIQSGALRHFFQLNFEICTTDLVVEEVKVPEQQRQLEIYHASGHLKIIALESGEIRDAVQLPTRWELKGIVDRTVLLKAIHLQCMVLSGDGNLRKECEHRRLEVHGSIWVIREIWLAELAAPEQLLEMLEVLGRNTWLPEKELDKMRKEIGEGE